VIVPPSNAAYEACGAGAACIGMGTSCVSTEFTTGVGTGFLCTAPCQTPADCPADPGSNVDCVIDAGSPAGQCYIDCNQDPNACKGGTECASLGGFSICVP
jgi:hypothetical protein